MHPKSYSSKLTEGLSSKFTDQVKTLIPKASVLGNPKVSGMQTTFLTYQLSSKVYIFRKGYDFTSLRSLILLIAIAILFKQNPKPYRQSGLVQIRLGEARE